MSAEYRSFSGNREERALSSFMPSPYAPTNAWTFLCRVRRHSTRHLSSPSTLDCTERRAMERSPAILSGETPKVVPPVPLTVEDTGLDPAFLADLTLRTVYADPDCTTERIADRLCLPTSVTETLLQNLYRGKFIEIHGKTAANGHRYGMLQRGWQRAQRLLEVSDYINPAPVSLPAYTMMSELQERE